MLPITINYAIKRFEELCLRKNEAMDFVTIIRNTKKGPVEVKRRPKAVSDGAMGTGVKFICLYRNTYKKKGPLMDSPVFEGELPSLYTNSEQMAKFRNGLSARTIRNHIKELKEIGLIKTYQFHGTTHDYSMTLCPEILWGAENVSLTGKMPEFEAISTTLDFEPNSINGKNFPPKKTKEHKDTVHNTTGKKENIPLLKILGDGNTPVVAQTLPGCHTERVDGNKNGAAAAENVENYVDNSEGIVGKAAPGTDFLRLERYFQKALRHFWNHAVACLWPGRQFSEYEQLMALDLILDGFYRPFLNHRPIKRQFDEFQTEMLKALEVGGRHYANHPKQYPGDPYSSYFKNNGYFDAQNIKGFNVAIKYRRLNKAAEDEKYGERVIKAGIRHINGLESGEVPMKFKNYTLNQLVDHYLIKMKRFSPKLQADFMFRLSTTSLFKPEVSFFKNPKIVETARNLKMQTEYESNDNDAHSG